MNANVINSVVAGANGKLIYLKTQPDGVPSVVGYRYAPPIYRTTRLADYPAC